jgi:starch-binding outer membrane protein, SusD/RagB family
MNISKIRLVVLASCLALTTACEKDLLDQVNPNQPTTASFWQTSADAIKGVNGAYSGLQQLGTYRRWLNFAFDIRGSDEGFSQSPWGELADWNRFVQVNYDFEVSQNIWRDHYRAIWRCNQVIDLVPGISMDATLKGRVIAEARFLRALYYYNLVSLYGNVPLVLQNTTSLDTKAPQGTEAQVWAQIQTDLEAAKPNLPLSYTGADIGRATKGAATTLLGKVHMQNRRWSEASAQFSEVINSGQYSLTTNYTDNFRHTTENNPESIFEVQFSDVRQGGNDGDDATSSEGGQRSQFWGAPGGFGFNDGEVRPWVVNEFLKEGAASGERDPRLAATVFYNRADQTQFPTARPVDGDTLVYGTGFLTRYGGDARNRARVYWRKYQTDYYRTFENFDSPINHRVMRYADVLLLQAEALNEQGNNGAAVPLINQVRQRAGLAPLVGLAGTTLRDQIRHERVTELTGEGLRWFDLRRWGLLDNQAGVDELKGRDAEFNTFVLNKSRLLPIPRTDVDLAGLQQNPGW